MNHDAAIEALALLYQSVETEHRLAHEDWDRRVASQNELSQKLHKLGDQMQALKRAIEEMNNG